MTQDYKKETLQNLKVGDYVIINDDQLGYGQPAFDNDYIKYLNTPVMISDVRPENKDNDVDTKEPMPTTLYTIDNFFGCFWDNIKEVVTKETNPEYFL